jgi:hypothetical protein
MYNLVDIDVQVGSSTQATIDTTALLGDGSIRSMIRRETVDS